MNDIVDADQIYGALSLYDAARFALAEARHVDETAKFAEAGHG